jgi:RimJ/RimL family protein N-acetyltransferase
VSIYNEDILLETSKVILQPIQTNHIEGLIAIANDASIWSYFTSELSAEEAMKTWVETAIQQRANNTRYPFVIIDKATNSVVGSSSYGNISERDKRLEIGWTWLGKDFQGTGLNRHCKYLLINYTFETLQYERVEFKTDVLNLQSRKALLKIGATEEGVLRSHTLMPHNRRRDTIFFSILRNEWEEIRNERYSDFL